jgi:hypothetical protein
MKETIPFFKTIWLALNPWRYEEVNERTAGNLFKYFFSFVFLVFVLSILLLLPAIGSFVTDQLSHFSKLEVSFNTTMKSPATFPAGSPKVTIDTRKSQGDLTEGYMLVTDDYLYTKEYLLFGKATEDRIGQYKNLVANEGIVILILVLMLPSLLFIFYLAYIIKLLLVILLAAVIGFIIARIAKFDIGFGTIFKVGLLASTPMIIIDLIRLPFGLNVYYAQYVAFLIFFVVGMIKAGEFEGVRKPGKRSRKGEYIDLGKSF